MKKIIIYIIFFCVWSTFLYSSETLKFYSAYKGLQVGRSTIDETEKLFGKPREILNKPCIKYIYRDLHITFNPSNKTVSTITIYDPEYIDLNGLCVGTSINTVKSFQNFKYSPKRATDFKFGITYWFENEKVCKIVLPYRLVKK